MVMERVLCESQFKGSVFALVGVCDHKNNQYFVQPSGIFCSSNGNHSAVGTKTTNKVFFLLFSNR